MLVMEYAVLRFEKVKAVGELRKRSRHNRRTTKVLPAHVDAGRAGENVIAGDAEKKFREMTEGKVMRKNGVLAVEVLMSFSPEMREKINVGEWARASREWVEGKFGADNVLEFALHMDETTPHIHMIFVPRDAKGKWNCRGILGGKEKLQALQGSYAEEMARFGLGKGRGGNRHIPVAVHRELEKLKKELEKAKMEIEQAKKATKKETKDRMIKDVRAYLGERRWEDFLSWLESRKKKKALNAISGNQGVE